MKLQINHELLIYTETETPTRTFKVCVDSREKGIQHPLTGQKRMIGGQLLGDGAHLSHGPHLDHGELLLHALELQLQHHILTHDENTEHSISQVLKCILGSLQE